MSGRPHVGPRGADAIADASLIFNVLVRNNTGPGLNAASSNMEKFKAATSIAAVGAAGAMAAIGTASVKAAADQSAAVSAWTQVTGKQMDAQQQIIARSLNLSQTEYAKSFTTLSSLYQSNGIEQKKANAMAAEGLKLAADQAAFGNTTVAEAVEAQAGLLKGSGELLEKYAISITAADVAARMKATGADKLKGAELKAAAAAAKMALVQEQSAKFTGQAARESGSLESRQQRLTATIEDMKAKLGAALLPQVEKFIGKLQSMADWVEQNETKAKAIVIVVSALAATIVTAAIAIKAYQAAMMVAKVATAVWTGAMWLLNAAFLANPIVGITVLIVGLVAVVVLIAKKTDWFQRLWSAAWGAIKGAASAVFNWVKSNWPLILAILTGPIGIAVGIIVKFWGQIKGAFSSGWNAIKSGATDAKKWVVGRAQDIVNFFTSIPDKIGDLGRMLYQKGVDLVQGLVDGIVDNAMRPVNAVKDIAANVASKATFGLLDFGSPSRLYRKYGQWLVEGFELGVKDRQKKVDDAMATMTDRLVASIDKMKVARDKARDIASGIKDAFTSFGNVTSVETGKDFLSTFLARADKAEAFARGIATLRKKGLNSAAINQLTAAGPEQGLGTVEQLLNQGGIGTVNSAMARISAAGEKLGNREAYLRTGTSVDMQGRAVVGRGKQKVVIDLNLNGESGDLTEAIVKALRKKIRSSGGDAQVVLGTR